jgi:hypothetical protein
MPSESITRSQPQPAASGGWRAGWESCPKAERAARRLSAWSRHGSTSCCVQQLVSRIFASWNQLGGWLRQVDRLRQAA